MRGERAVVLGGSIAGLLAARALTEAYERATVVERDAVPDGPVPRRGVPQGRHTHALLAGGQRVLEEQLPGLTAELAAEGAPIGDMLADSRLVFGGHRFASTGTGLVLLSVTRPRIEAAIRRRVVSLPGVEVAPRADVVGIRAAAQGRRLRGVRTVPRCDGGAEEVLDADLVVDATGRGSQVARWLADLGASRPPEERVDVGITYATRRYRLPVGAIDGALACIVGPTTEVPRGGGLSRVEDDVWLATLFGYHDDVPPADPSGFEAFAGRLPSADIAGALAAAEPLDDPVRHRFPTAVRRRYDRVRALPEGFVAVGDAVCTLNPIYGQGMSVAALQAQTLRRELVERRGTTGRAARAAARVVGDAWRMATGADLAIPGVPGRPGPADRAMARYIGRVQAAAVEDPSVAAAFVRVAGLVDRPATLVRPAVLARAVRTPRG